MNSNLLRLFLLAATALSLQAEPLDAILDGPRPGLRAAADRAWLLEETADLPTPVWPRPRADWLQGSPSPALLWHRAAMPWRLEHEYRHTEGWEGLREAMARMLSSQAPDSLVLEPEGLLGLHHEELLFSLDLRLPMGHFEAETDAETRSIDESGIGADMEVFYGNRLAAWMRFRDAGWSGDLEVLDHPAFTQDDEWAWDQYQVGTKDVSHDETRAGLVWMPWRKEHSRLLLGLQREQVRWGTGLLRTVLINGDHAPAMSTGGFRLDVGHFDFQWMTADLESRVADSLNARTDESGLTKIPFREKWMIAHRLGWHNRHFSLGVGEMIIMGDEGVGLGYLNPVNFYWSEQHARGDRENTLLLFDARVRVPSLVPGHWMLNAELSVDDYTMADWGDELEGQKTASLLGFSGTPLKTSADHLAMEFFGLRLPGISWLTLEQVRVRPYFGTHFYAVSRLDHGLRSLGAWEHPNTRITEWEWRHELLLTPRFLAANQLLLTTRITGGHLVHGQNYLDENGTLVNVGGDRFLPHREWADVQESPFLAGVLETHDWLTFGLGLDCALMMPGKWIPLLGRQRDLVDLGTLSFGCEYTRWEWRESPQAALAEDTVLAWSLGWQRPF